MNAPRGFVPLAIWAYAIAVSPLCADDEPRTQPQGFECQIVRDDAAVPGTPKPPLRECQIGDDGEPMTAHIVPPLRSPEIDSIRHPVIQLLRTLRRAWRERLIVHAPTDAPQPTP
jgi:hypothetical protein